MSVGSGVPFSSRSSDDDFRTDSRKSGNSPRRDLKVGLTTSARFLLSNGPLPSPWLTQQRQALLTSTRPIHELPNPLAPRRADHSDSDVQVPHSRYPPIESFGDFDRTVSASKFEAESNIGDKLYGKVVRCDRAGAFVQPLCFAQRMKRDLERCALEIPVLLSATDRRLRPNDLVIIEICELRPKMSAVLEGSAPLTDNDLPLYFREARTWRAKRFRDYVINCQESNNPYLTDVLQIGEVSTYSYLNFFDSDQDLLETAQVIRRRQDNAMAISDVVRGVSEMKKGEVQMAINHFNNALAKNPDCVDALVARGAAYSNLGEYGYAETDLQKAFDIYPEHPNAKSYLIETLVTYAKTLELGEQLEAAKAKYMQVLRLRDDRRAKAGLEKIEREQQLRRRRSLAGIGKPSGSGLKRKSMGPSGAGGSGSGEKRQPSAAEKEKDEREKRAAAEETKRQLDEMESYIANLKNKK